MKSFVVILSCLAAVTLAIPTSDITVEFLANGRSRCRLGCNAINPLSCPPTNCGPVVWEGNCGRPDCTIPGNRAVLHPSNDPNFYYQCVQDEFLNHVPMLRPCACGTLFHTSQNRCIHPADWRRECPSQPEFPNLNECIEDCPGQCDDDGGPITPAPPTNAPWTPAPPTDAPWTPAPPTTQPPVEGPGGPDDTTASPPNGCNCPCIPCIWWPCMPCMPICTQCQQPQNPWQQPQQLPQQLPQQPQNPWQRPQPNPQPQPRPQPQDPWQRPQQIPQPQPIRPQPQPDPWQRPQQRPQQPPQNDNWNRQW